MQAGGCCGLWPLALSTHFKVVHTFEPVPSNFQYLEQNITFTETRNIVTHPYALGDRIQLVGMSRPKPQAGLWKVDSGSDIVMTTLDAMLNGPIDAIVLDVEGHEANVLRGAERLITTYHPLLWFEFLYDQDTIVDLITAYGYTPPIRGFEDDFYSIAGKR